MKILVISSYFGPETSVGVLRINALVKYWVRKNHIVHVITMPYTGQLTRSLRNKKRLTVHQIRPLFLNRCPDKNSQCYSKEVKGIWKIILNFQYWLKIKIFSNYLDPRILWWPRAALFACRCLTPKIGFDFVFSTVPSYTAHSAAALVKVFNEEIKWVADYRDLWCGNPMFPGCGLIQSLEKIHEVKVLKKADLIVSINGSLIKELKKLHGEKRNYAEVPNGYDEDELTAHKLLRKKKKSGKIKIIYAGSILPGLQDPTPLLQALQELAQENKINPENLSVEFYGNSTALESNNKYADENVQRYIKRCSKVPRPQIMRAEKSADLLLFLGSKPISEELGSTVGVVSGKIFEYMISGTEVLAIGVTDKMLVAEMLIKSGTGKHYGTDVEKIKERIVEAICYGVKKVRPNMKYLNQFRRSLQANAILRAVQSLT